MWNHNTKIIVNALLRILKIGNEGGGEDEADYRRKEDHPSGRAEFSYMIRNFAYPVGIISMKDIVFATRG